MAKRNYRDALLAAGFDAFYKRGYHASGVQEIVNAADIPKGSFYNHFASKDALGLAALDHYWERNAEAMALLADERLKPLERLDKHLVALGYHEEGCMIGNFSAELAGNETFRPKLSVLIQAWRDEITACLAAGQITGEVRADLKADALARIVLSSFEGAMLVAKVLRSPEPLRVIRQTILALMAPAPTPTPVLTG